MILAKMKRILVLMLVSSPGLSQEVHRNFTYRADLTGDGRAEKIVLDIHGADIRTPFQWSLSVTDTNGRVLFKVEKDDSWIDEAYGDPNYMGGCSGYEQCKRRYYFEEKPRSLATCLKSGDTQRSAKFFGFDNSSEAARQFLESKNTSPSTIDAALKELQGTLQNKSTLSLCYQEHEEDHGKLLVWLKTVGEFVPYYEP
jgi:hypothetical protein